MKINWTKYKKNIPSRVKIASKLFYEILYTKQFPDNDTYGETRFDKRQIVLKTKMGPKTLGETYLHEVLHALSAEHDIGLTETQVVKFEQAFPYLIDVINKLEGIDE